MVSDAARAIERTTNFSIFKKKKICK